MAKRQKIVPGDVLRIDLGNGNSAFTWALHEPFFAFFDINKNVDSDFDIRDLLTVGSIIFKVAVMKRAQTRWDKCGHRELPPELKLPITFFRQDAINGKLFIHVDDVERPATFEECKHLERAAVWEPEHVEDRLRDYFAGQPNAWVESLRPKAIKP